MKWLCTALLLGASSLAFGECSPPPPEPSLPDGATADRETMLKANKAVKEYVAGTEAYLACLTDEEAEEEITDPEILQGRVDQHNAVFEKMNAVAGKFNEEVRAFKARTAE